MKQKKLKIYYKNPDGKVVQPFKAHPTDAGYDVYATTGPVIRGRLSSLANDLILDDPEVYAEIDYIEYGTNLFVQPDFYIDRGFDPIDKISFTETPLELIMLSARPRSSISKYNLLMCNEPKATIDANYRGEIKFRFKYVYQPSDLVGAVNGIDHVVFGTRVNYSKIYQKGDKIAQIIPQTVMNVDEWIPVDLLDDTDRGETGFGDSGK